MLSAPSSHFTALSCLQTGKASFSYCYPLAEVPKSYVIRRKRLCQTEFPPPMNIQIKKFKRHCDLKTFLSNNFGTSVLYTLVFPNCFIKVTWHNLLNESRLQKRCKDPLALPKSRKVKNKLKPQELSRAYIPAWISRRNNCRKNKHINILIYHSNWVLLIQVSLIQSW